ncbi:MULTISPECIES: ParB/RepB/Spo0J family partition protein [Terrabacteria group]|uniref:ParB/RepB/Spo0J family partition protein n=1 Tax=Bacillati TaxID=1783272 RepID=UPI00193A3434|nr:MULTISPECIES: ParB/RepB/Spo0J family partition protein [Terrabacteria group]MBW9211924.1 ParB/RepB/Spo0J family partition protein [Trueperella sp. zg.1013]QRG87275.1 ParB-like nuclease domain-containing protein [Bulleidia sp. zg-1006]
MITKKVLLKEIVFQDKPNEILKKSIEQRGMAIPVRVKEVDEGYLCLDGHQRLTCLQELGKKEAMVCIENNFKKAGSGFWGHTQNHH